MQAGGSERSYYAAAALSFGLVVYAAAIEPWIARAVFGGGPPSSIWLWLVSTVILAEGWAWAVLARPRLRTSSPTQGNRPTSAAPAHPESDSIGLWLLLLLFLRTAVEVCMVFGASEATGRSIKSMPPMTAAMTVLIVFKFLFCLLFVMGAEPAPPPARSRWIAAESIALSWSCLAYTMSWGRISTLSATLAGRPLGEALVQSFAAALLFLLLYCPIRVHAVLAVQRGERPVTQEWLLIGAVGALSIASLWGYNAWWIQLFLEVLGGG